MSTISNDNALKNVPPPNIYTSKTSFEQLLEASRLPPPGPSYYVARRALWLRCPPDTNATARESSPSVSRNKLENLLSTPAAIYDDEIWESGIHKVWKGLSAGASLKRRLPLNLVIKIIHCAWVRDETWPAGAVAPEPDDVLEETLPSEVILTTTCDEPSNS